MQHTAAAQTHFGDRRHRQLRWRSFIKRQQADTAICKEISGGSKETVVAYGDAKFSSSCCKGNPSTPTESLRRKFGHCCQVYDTDEFRTSKLCCACKTAMDGMPLPLLGNTYLCCPHWLRNLQRVACLCLVLGSAVVRACKCQVNCTRLPKTVEHCFKHICG